MGDQCAQLPLEFSLGVHRIPLRGNCNLTEPITAELVQKVSCAFFFKFFT